jgi:hypothetical protein
MMNAAGVQVDEERLAGVADRYGIAELRHTTAVEQLPAFAEDLRQVLTVMQTSE